MILGLYSSRYRLSAPSFRKCILYIYMPVFVEVRNDFKEEERKRKSKINKEIKIIKILLASTSKIFVSVNSALEFPVFCVFDGFDSPSELVSQSLGEEFLDRNIEFLRENYRQTRINVVLEAIVSTFCINRHTTRLTIFEVLRATSLLPSRSSA